jgi:maltose alpha-D-glucosyltransferase/alpha-amylase
MFNELYKNEKDLNLAPYFERGDNYFSENGKGTVKNFLHYVNFLYEKLGDKGMFTAPTGTHDEVRMPTRKSTDIIKCIFAFALTLKHVPMIYYGDEIGMVHNYSVSKDGGGKRTGARTPMQWTEGKNRGFSSVEEKNLYLPVDHEVGRSVESQQKDENSLLNTVRKLVEIKKSHTALNVSSAQETVYMEGEGYPYIFRRKSADESILVAINPSSESKSVTMKGEVLFGNNYKKDGDKVELTGSSFLIVKE